MITIDPKVSETYTNPWRYTQIGARSYFIELIFAREDALEIVKRIDCDWLEKPIRQIKNQQHGKVRVFSLEVTKEDEPKDLFLQCKIYPDTTLAQLLPLVKEALKSHLKNNTFRKRKYLKRDVDFLFQSVVLGWKHASIRREWNDRNPDDYVSQPERVTEIISNTAKLIGIRLS